MYFSIIRYHKYVRPVYLTGAEEDTMEVRFYDHVNDNKITYAVIIARANGKWVFCKHKDRDTWEFPGGHREANEIIEDTARRELHEETGAIEFSIVPVCPFGVFGDVFHASIESEDHYGMLYVSEINGFEKNLHYEMEEILLLDNVTDHWTYPIVQPLLLKEARRRGFIK